MFGRGCRPEAEIGGISRGSSCATAAPAVGKVLKKKKQKKNGGCSGAGSGRGAQGGTRASGPGSSCLAVRVGGLDGGAKSWPARGPGDGADSQGAGVGDAAFPVPETGGVIEGTSTGEPTAFGHSALYKNVTETRVGSRLGRAAEWGLRQTW